MQVVPELIPKTDGDAPTPAPPARSLFKTIALVSVAALILYTLFAFGLIDGARMRDAFSHHLDLLGLTVACFLGVTIATSIRHKVMLSLFIPVTWGKITAANVISQAVGQWSPGSLAVMEAVRIGLMLGDRREPKDSALAWRVAIASLIDRITSLGILFLLSCITALIMAARELPSRRANELFGLAGLTFMLGGVLIALPLCADVWPMRPLRARLARIEHPRVAGITRRITEVLDHLSTASSTLRSHPSALVAAYFLSFLVALLNPLSWYCAGAALGEPIPFLLLAAILPTTIASIILPIGFAGFGGPQLVAIAHFALFGVDAETVGSTSLLQNTVALTVQTVLGIAWSVAYAHTLGTVLRARRQRKA